MTAGRVTTVQAGTSTRLFVRLQGLARGRGAWPGEHAGDVGNLAISARAGMSDEPQRRPHKTKGG